VAIRAAALFPFAQSVVNIFHGRTISFENIQTKLGNAQSVERGTLPLRLMAHSAGRNVRDCIVFVLVWRNAHDEFPSLRLFNSRQRASSFLVANLNRRRFAAYRKRDEKIPAPG
jgi:hypothetical protein